MIQSEQPISTARLSVADVMVGHYLAEFVLRGGAAAKGAGGPRESTRSFQARIVSEGRKLKYLAVSVDAADHRIHMVKKFFFAISYAVFCLQKEEERQHGPTRASTH